MINLSPLNKRRLNNFVSNKRGFYSFWLFTILFIISLFANFVANEKPLLVKYNSVPHDDRKNWCRLTIQPNISKEKFFKELLNVYK